jgi:hypothetical protein
VSRPLEADVCSSYNYQLEIPQEYSFKENRHMNRMWRLLARMGIMYVTHCYE